MFKPAIPLMGLLIIALFSTASMCNKADDAPPEFTSLIGKWQLNHFTFEAVKQDGEVISSLNEFKKNGNQLFWEFFDNGLLHATDESNTPIEANWELKVERLDGLNIDRGQLTLTGSYADQLKAALELDAMVYFIETSTEANSMSLAVDASKTSTVYSKVTITYVYQKI